MASVTDEKGFNQSYVETEALEIRTARRAQAILKEFGEQSPSRLLELGCGTGGFSRYFAQHSSADILAVDISQRLLDTAQAMGSFPNLRYEEADLLTPRFYEGRDGKYDGIIGNGVLHHLVKHFDELAPRFHRLLAPGGHLVFWEPNIYNPYVYPVFTFPILRKIAKLDPDEMAFSPGFFKEKFAQWFDVQVDFRDFLLPNVPAMLIKPTIMIGDKLEKTPLKVLAQSLFISATKKMS